MESESVARLMPARTRRNYPKGWIVTRPNTDTNKEAGTVSTGDYGRGDSAALFVAPKSLVGGSSLASKDAVEGVVKKALSQKVCVAYRGESFFGAAPFARSPGGAAFGFRFRMSYRQRSDVLLHFFSFFFLSTNAFTACPRGATFYCSLLF